MFFCLSSCVLRKNERCSSIASARVRANIRGTHQGHSGIVPAIRNDSNITPIPKIQSPTNEGVFKPISLTPCLSKVLEDFVVT